jgi:hypothetical protein
MMATRVQHPQSSKCSSQRVKLTAGKIRFWGSAPFGRCTPIGKLALTFRICIFVAMRRVQACDLLGIRQ